MGLFTKVDSKRLQELEAMVTSLESENHELQNEVIDNRKTIAAFVGVKTGYEKEVNVLNSKHSEAIKQLNAELEVEKKSIARKVNMTLANMGVNTFAPEEITEVKYETPIDVYKKWQALTGYDKGKYFKENEAVIKQARSYLERKQI